MMQKFILCKPTCTKVNTVHEGKQNEVMWILTPLVNQKGAFSPFMFGLLAGVATLSGLMQHWAKEELVRIEERRSQLTQEKAEDVRRAVENMILTENVDSGEGYNRFFSLDGLKGNLSDSTGKTRSGLDVQVNSTEKTGKFGEVGQRLIITATDDAFIRNEVGSAGAEATASDTVTIVDTTEIRQQQIEQSKEKLEMEAAQIYRLYISNDFKFPSKDEYDDYNSKTGLKDTWGNSFDYEKKSDKKAILSFTTPWGYTFDKTLSTE